MLLAFDQRGVCALGLLLLCQIFSLTSAYTKVSDDSLKSLRRPTSADFDIQSGRILAPILIPRVPGTENSTIVLLHFFKYFEDNLPEWTLEFEKSMSTTPDSNGEEIPFTNFIAYRDPPWASPSETGRLTLVAHYDSKAHPEGFIGAIDSAAPCAMIMHAVHSLDAALTAKWSAMQSSSDTLDFDNQGIQVIFLDGEEAFQTWTGTDSLYGARALASTWESRPPGPPAPGPLSPYKNRLEQISLFLLLDLLGAKSPSIPSYFKTTHWAYRHLSDLEQRLRSLGSFQSSPGDATWLPDSWRDAHASDTMFNSWGMQDDHIPFIARGVEVLHVIPNSFPSVWHTINDDGEHLDMPTVEDWTVLVAGFIAEWMDLDDFVKQVDPAMDVAARSGTRKKPRENVKTAAAEDDEKRWQDVVAKVISKTEL